MGVDDSLRSRCIEAGARRVLGAASEMRRSHISLIPRPKYALTDVDGLARLGVDDVVRLALDAILACLSENADEWADYPENTDPIVVAHREIIARKLLAVLRNPE